MSRFIFYGSSGLYVERRDRDRERLKPIFDKNPAVRDGRTDGGSAEREKKRILYRNEPVGFLMGQQLDQ